MGKVIKIASWNVNGLKSVLGGSHGAWLYDAGFDIICLQEAKMQENLVTGLLFDPKKAYWNTAKKKGYSGVTTIVNPDLEPQSVSRGIGINSLDDEGRVLTTELADFYLVNTYAPHSHRQLLRVKEKEAFCTQFVHYIVALRKKGKPIIIAGDLNVAHEEIDLYNYRTNYGNAGFLPQERRWFGEMLELGLVDAFRHLHPEKKQYSWWGFAHNLRERNIGWRLDYFLIDSCLKDSLHACQYDSHRMGSDHCPVSITIEMH